MRILFAGTPANAAQTLEALVSSGLDIVGVLTRPDSPIGRKQVLTPSPVASLALAHGIPLIRSNQVEQTTLEEIAELNADIGVVVAYGSLLNTQALEALPKGWINLHYSLLPKLRGAAPVQAAIKQGLQETGISLFQLDEGMDTGKILMQIPTQIQPGENSGRLMSRLTDLGISGLLELLPGIAAGFANAKAQDSNEATFAPKISRGEARISWTADCRAIENLINAMNPEPVAWTTLRDESFRVLEARTSLLSFADSDPGYPAGTVYESGTKVLVACNNGDALELLVVQPAGKKAMSASDWLRGQKDKDQIVFE
mgnify:FL=1